MDFVYKLIEVIVLGVVLVPTVYFSNILGNLIFERNVIKIKYHTDGIDMVQYGDWIDLKSAEDVDMKKGEFKTISLGIGMKLPKNFEAHVVPRSSTFKTWGILQANSMGVIDNKYSGNDDIWLFPAYATKKTSIKKGDRICQFRIIEKANMKIEEVDSLDEVNRGGYGSTGTR